MDELYQWLRKFGYKEADIEVSETIPNAVKLHPKDGMMPLCVLPKEYNSAENRIRLWNENEAEAIFEWSGSENGRLIDAKVPPTERGANLDDSVICELPKRQELLSGAFWISNANRYISKNRKPIDIHLVEALTTLLKNVTSELKKSSDAHQAISASHGLIDRCVFISFLDHRDLWRPPYRLSEVLQVGDEKKLRNLFGFLKERFNGDISRATLPSKISAKVMWFLKDIFSLNPVSDRQVCLYPYRFDLINIDLISSIFETFIGETSRWNNADSGAYYSPPKIALRVVERTLIPYINGKSEAELMKTRIVDPCCGSGVFLVHAFRFLRQAIDSKRISSGKSPLCHRERVNLMLDCLQGWDIEPTAIRIAAFSLCMSLLEGLKKIPSNFKFPYLIGSVLEEKDGLLGGNVVFDEKAGDYFLNPRENVENDCKLNYDIVLGNPPWGFKKFSNSYKGLLKRRYPQPNKGSSSEAFTFRFLELAGESGRVGIILNSSVWANRTSSFRMELEKTAKLEQVLELSEVHDVLGYSTSGESNSILIFSPKNDKRFTFSCPQLTPFSKAFKIVLMSDLVQEKMDISYLNSIEEHFGVNQLTYMKSPQLVRKVLMRILENNTGNGVLDAQKGGQIKKGTNVRMPFKAQKIMSPFIYEKDKYAHLAPSGMRRTAVKAQGFNVLIRRRQVKGRLLTAVKKDKFTIYDDVISANSDMINASALAGMLSSKLIYFLLLFLAKQFGHRSQSYLDDTAIKLLPLPDLENNESRSYIEKVASIVSYMETNNISVTHNEFDECMDKIDALVYEMYGVTNIERHIIDNVYRAASKTMTLEGARKSYETILYELADIDDMHWSYAFGGMMQVVSTCESPREPEQNSIPIILAGGSHIDINAGNVTVYRMNDLRLWSAANAIYDANKISSKMLMGELRKAV